MDRNANRRTLLKGSAGAIAAALAATQSSVIGPRTAIAAPAVVKQTGSKIDVLYWGSFSAERGEVEQEVVRRFNESQPDVTVEYQFQGTYEETAQKLTAALQARQAPDISLLSEVNWPRFYLNRSLAPLNDFIAANELDTADFVDAFYDEGVRDGTVYWLPFARSTPLFYYNKAAYAEAGLPDRGPETWTEFMEWAPKLVKKDGDTVARSAFAHPTAAQYIAWYFQGVIWQFGGAYSDPDFTIRIAEPAGVEAGEFFRRSTLEGWATTPQDRVVDFTNGLTASIMESTGGLSGIAANAQFEVGTAFLPRMKEFGCCTGGAGLAVLAGSPSEKQEAAFKYLQFATSPEMVTFWTQRTGYMPTRESAIQSPEMQTFFAENPNFKTAVDQLPLTRPQDVARLFIPNGDQIIGKGLERITVNNEEAQPVLEEVARTLEEEAQPIKEAIEALG